MVQVTVPVAEPPTVVVQFVVSEPYVIGFGAQETLTTAVAGFTVKLTVDVWLL
jgi:hypothetical protein